MFPLSVCNTKNKLFRKTKKSVIRSLSLAFIFKAVFVTRFSLKLYKHKSFSLFARPYVKDGSIKRSIVISEDEVVFQGAEDTLYQMNRRGKDPFRYLPDHISWFRHSITFHSSNSIHEPLHNSRLGSSQSRVAILSRRNDRNLLSEKWSEG